MERLFFKKIEVWIVFLLVIFSFVGTVLYGWVVRHTATGGEKAGAIGQLALDIASFPTLVVQLITTGGQAEKTITKIKPVSLHPLKDYEQLDFGPSSRLLYWAGRKEASSSYLAVQTFIDLQNERMLLFDQSRKFIGSFVLHTTSDDPRYPKIMGQAPHQFLEDGTVITWAYGGTGMKRITPCGEVLWTRDGLYHHHYAIDDKNIYVLGNPHANISEKHQELWNSTDIINIISLEDGKPVKSIPITEIAKKNLGKLDILLTEKWRKTVHEKGFLKKDFLHLNKVEVLTSSMAAQYPSLEEGMLLVSSRHLNLLFIFNPETLEIVWYSQGNTQVQHDPMFVGNNEIFVFNNSSNQNNSDPKHPSNFSNIKTYNFGTEKWSDYNDGSQIEAFTTHSGCFDMADNRDGIALVVTLQGRVVELDRERNAVFEFLSIRDEESVYWGREVSYLEPEAAAKIMQSKCFERTRGSK